MSFSPLSTETLNKYLEILGMTKLSIIEKMTKLQKLLGEGEFNEIVKKYKKASKNISNKKELRIYHANLVNNKIRYNGKPFIIKTRKLDLDKYYSNIEPKIILHAGIFFNKNTIYHNLPDGVKYGKEEYNKEEVAKYDWVTCEANKKGAFFTLKKNKEIKKFIMD